MSYLLDTHKLIWAVTNPDKLSDAARAIVADARNDVLVSVVSFWEISLNHNIQKLTLDGLTPEDFPVATLETGFGLLSLDAQTTSTYHRLTTTYHKDPFNRILIWQAFQNKFRLITKDENVFQYVSEGLQVVW